MSITLHDETGERLFKNGEVVFRIKAIDLSNKSIERHVNMATSKEDYEKQIQTHVYTPLLYICPFLLRVAYLYECLNRKMDAPRDENFIFSYRYIGHSEWYEWFTVNPVNDSLF